MVWVFPLTFELAFFKQHYQQGRIDEDVSMFQTTDVAAKSP